MVARRRKPTGEELYHLAENRPAFLNPLVAYFCFGWRGVTMSHPPHGQDQVGHTRVVPNYVGRYGVEACFSMLMSAPADRTSADDPAWIDEMWKEAGL